MLLDAAQSHLSWFGRGRERVDFDGVTLFLGEGAAVLAFPRLEGDLASAVRVAHASAAREVGCWSLRPDEELGEWLTGVGFQDGWDPHWMGIDPRSQPEAPLLRSMTSRQRDAYPGSQPSR